MTWLSVIVGIVMFFAADIALGYFLDVTICRFLWRLVFGGDDRP